MNRLKYFFFTLTFCLCYAEAKSQTPNSWARVSDFVSFTRIGAISFNTDSFGYIGMGLYQLDTFPYTPTYLTDLWQYNPSTNAWTQKASFPGVGRTGAICFTIDSMAYIGLGQSSTSDLNDFWEYDPATDTWIQLADFGGGYRTAAIGFSIGNKGYVGLGVTDTAQSLLFVKQDFWEYDPAIDAWTQMNDFAGGERENAIGFAIDSNGYVGFGDSQDHNIDYKSDLWQYAPSVDTWTPKANFTGMPREGAFTFTIGSRAYVGTGVDSLNIALSDFWEYNSLTDQWIEKDSFGGRVNASAFRVGNKGYAGIGAFPSAQFHSDFWMYTPDSIETGVRSIDLTPVSIFPDPASDKLYINTSLTNISVSISDMAGQSWPVFLSGGEIDVSALPAGVYCLRIQDSGSSVVRKFVKE